MGRVAIAEQRRSSQARVMNSLPPMLAQTTGKRWMATQSGSLNTNLRSLDDSPVESLKVPRSSSLRSPMVKMVAQEFNAERRDMDLAQSTLASQRLTQPKRSSLLTRDVSAQVPQTNSTRGLRRASQDVPVN